MRLEAFGTERRNIAATPHSDATLKWLSPRINILLPFKCVYVNAFRTSADHGPHHGTGQKHILAFYVIY